MERVVNIRGLFWQILDGHIWKIFNGHLQSLKEMRFTASSKPPTKP